MRTVESIEELRKVYKQTNSGVAGDTIFAATALMFLCELAVTRSRKIKRRPSKWQDFFGCGMKAGKTAKQIAKEWAAK